MWFDNFAESQSPGKQELMIFVSGLGRFLGDVVRNENDEFGFLWRGYSTSLRYSALESYETDIERHGIPKLLHVLPEINEEEVHKHGLEGTPLRFKLQVISEISLQWEKRRKKPYVRQWFKRLIDAIDSLLDSLVNAVGGIGYIVKEFKDSLGALA